MVIIFSLFWGFAKSVRLILVHCRSRFKVEEKQFYISRAGLNKAASRFSKYMDKRLRFSDNNVRRPKKISEHSSHSSRD